MKTAVLVESGPAGNASRSDAGGYAGSRQQTIPLVFEPARNARRSATRDARAGASRPAPKPKRVVVPFSGSKPALEAADARIHVPKPVFWELLELGFVMVLLSSVFALICLSVTAAGNL
jgi:hypothetical protein